MTLDAERASADAVPIPPRYWWLKRLSLAGAVLLLALAGLRLGWGWYAERKLAARIVPDAEQGNEAHCAAHGRQVRDLVAALLDETKLADQWRRVMYSERFMVSGLADLAGGGAATWIASGWGGPRLLFRGETGLVLGPMFRLDAIYMLDYYHALAEAGAAESWPAAKARLPSHPALEVSVRGFTHVLSRNVVASSLDGVIERRFDGTALRRMAATALAIRLYELHHAQRPQSLDLLVPKYLPTVPRDPFAGDGRPIGYLPFDPQPRLYSVGADGVDEAGAYELCAWRYVGWEVKDVPFFLNGDRPRRKPIPTGPATQLAQPASAQAGDDKGDIESDQGRDREKEGSQQQP